MHESVNERSGEILARDQHPAPGERTTMGLLLSRDSTDYFVNFNLYACSLVSLGRSTATQTAPLTRGRKPGDLPRPEMQRDMHIRISDRDVIRRASLLISRIHYPIGFTYDRRRFRTIASEEEGGEKRFEKHPERKLHGHKCATKGKG